MDFKFLRPLALFAGLLVLFVAITFAIYWPGLHGGFFFDDEANILLPEGVRLSQFSVAALREAMASGHAGLAGRAVAQLSFALNYRASGFDPFAFKATNLVLHFFNALLVYFLARRLLAFSNTVLPPNTLTTAAVSVASIWLVHPLQVTSVLLVVQRMTILSALFLFSAFLLHMAGRDRKGSAAWGCYFLAWAILWPLSFFSKETGALFPLFVLVWELTARRSLVGHLDRFVRWLMVALCIALMLGIAYALSDAGKWLWAGYQFRSFSLLQRLLTEGRVVWFYLGLIFMPSMERLGLHHDDLLVSTTLFTPWATLPSLTGIFALAWLVWILRNRAPLISFGIVWFMLGHSLESTVLPLEIAHEHRNYVPSFGIVLASVSAIVPLLASSGTRKTLGLGLVGLSIAYFSIVTALRAQQFGDDLVRTQVEAQHHRNSSRAQYDAGQVLSRLAATEPKGGAIHSLARRHFELAMELDPSFKLGGLGLIYIDCLHGSGADRRWIDELETRLRTTPFSPGDTALLHGLKEMTIAGTLCLKRLDVDALFAATVANARIDAGTRAKLHSWHADYLWQAAKDLPGALDAIRESLRLVPSNPSNRLKYAQLLLISGNQEQARQIMMDLRGARLSSSEQKTLDSLLTP